MDRSQSRDSIIGHLLRSTISNYVGRFIGLVTWFALTPFVLDQLEPTFYGLWVLVGSVTSYGALLDFGIAGTITKYVAEFRAREQWEDAQHLVGTALVTYLTLGGLVVLASLAFAPLFPRIFNVPADNQSLARLLVILSGIGTGLAIPSNSTSAVLRGLQRFDLLNLFGIIGTLLLAGATIAVLLLGGGVIGFVVTGISVNFLMLIPNIWIIHRIAPDLRFGSVGASREMFKRLTSFSSSLFMLRIGGQLETKTDELVIGAFLPVSAVTPYNLARKLSAFPQMLTEQFLSLLLPLTSKLHAENEMSRLRTVYMISTRLTLAIFLALGASLIFLAAPFLTVWLGEEFAQYSPLVLILSLASLIDTTTWPAGLVLQGMGLPRFSGIMSIFAGLANLTLSLFLVRRLGLTGVALGTLIPTAVVCIGFVLPYTMRAIGAHIHDVVNQVLIPTSIPAIPSSIAIYILTKVVPLTSIPSVLFVGGAGLIIYVLAYLSIESNAFERELFRNILMNIFQQARSYIRSTERSNP